MLQASLRLLSLTLVATAVACGGSEPEPQAPLVQPTATATTAQPSATAAPTVSAQPTATGPAPSPIAPIEPALAQAAQAVLNEVAKTEAPVGAKALGMPTVNLLGAGQASETSLSMAPGKCYTIIAVGLPPVSELNVQLLPATTVPGLQTALAEDLMVGPRAVVGKTPNCFKWPLPVAGAARVVTTVATGQGLVATAVYEK
jgi:hypothetical protein